MGQNICTPNGESDLDLHPIRAAADKGFPKGRFDNLRQSTTSLCSVLGCLIRESGDGRCGVGLLMDVIIHT